MKSLIIYFSNNGCTMDYAEYLAQKTYSKLSSTKDIDVNELSSYDHIILGTNVRFGKLGISPWILKNKSKLKGLNLYLYIVHGIPDEKQSKSEIFLRDIPKGLIPIENVFAFKGRLIYKQMHFGDKIPVLFSRLLLKKFGDTNMIAEDFDDFDTNKTSELIRKIYNS
ncbi:MAG: flavodoxin domain-containing protein [bacterium]